MYVCVCDVPTHLHRILVCVTMPMWVKGGTKVKMSDRGQQSGKFLSCSFASLFTSNSFSVIEDDAFAGLSHLQYL